MNKLVRLGIFFLFVTLMGMTTPTVASDGIKNQGFILNQGQWPDRILSRASFSFGDVIVQKDGILFYLRDKSHSHSHHPASNNKSDTLSVRTRSHVYKMKFRNGTLHAPTGFNPSVFQVNYIKGNDATKWAKGLACYQKLVIADVYPNIDLVLYSTDNGMKYDLFLKAKADPKQITIDYEGADGLSIDEQGNLQIKTSLGNITEQMPIAFLEKESQSREPVICRYQLTGNTVRFSVKNLSRNKQEKLIIDPQLIFATYSQSTADNWGNTATYDSTGALYAAGIAFDQGFPVTLGAYDSTFNSVYGSSNSFNGEGDPDIAIMKFSASGTLIYATYLGGGIAETPTSTIVNSNGELYILGTTGSRGAIGEGAPFPTTPGAYQQVFKGGSAIYPLGYSEGIYHPYGSDLFISRLNSDGSSLLSSTLVGGTGNDGLLLNNDVLARNYGDVFRSEILLDSMGDVYIASHTQSTDILDLSKPGYNKTYAGGGRDGIVMKLTADLSAVVWNTYFGGNGLDACYSLQFGVNKTIYVSGGTTSTNLSTHGGLEKVYNGDVDGFIFNLSLDGNTLINATYIGTSLPDQCYLVQTDEEGFVYVLGQSIGSYPVANAPYSNRGAHQFIHKLNSDLDSTVFSTVIGSSGKSTIDFVPTAFLVNECGNIFLSGWGGVVNDPNSYYVQDRFGNIYIQTDGTNYQGGDTYNLPITSNAFQKTTDGNDFYLMVLKKDAAKLLYSTYIGGNNEIEHVDGGTSRFDKRGIVYQSVCAGCGGTSHFPVTDHSTNHSFNCNNAVFKFDLSSLKADFIVDTTKICNSGPVTFTNTSLGGASYNWQLGDGGTSTSSTSFTHTYTKPGTYTAKLFVTDETTCKAIDSAQKIINVYNLPSGDFIADTAIICKGDTAQINATYNANYTYLWTPNQYLIDNTVYNPRAYPPSTKLYYVTIKDQVTQCINTDSALVMIVQAFADTDYENLTGCSGQPVVRVRNESDKEGFTYLWNFGDGSTSSDAQQTTHTYSDFGDYIVSVTVSNHSCGITDTVHVHLPLVKIPNLFTPNGDNHNDKYVIEGMTANWKLEIYNRWGNPIYTREPYDQSWDGGDLSGGVYYFLITDPAGNKCKGWVEVFK
ncbi:MAG: hypothetical protein JWO58_1361 [Chitinophagaceae bacterium]|nr:hypothetical protein [Chitinophagaceae bacterium]